MARGCGGAQAFDFGRFAAHQEEGDPWQARRQFRQQVGAASAVQVTGVTCCEAFEWDRYIHPAGQTGAVCFCLVQRQARRFRIGQIGIAIQVHPVWGDQGEGRRLWGAKLLLHVLRQRLGDDHHAARSSAF